MRQKRAKAYRKLMHLYSMSFGFRQPYQVLVDSEMCTEAVSSKMDLAKQLSTVLQGNVKPMITQCCIHALYLSGRNAQAAVDLAKTFERRRCNHRVEADGKMKDETECLADVVGDRNKHRYVLAAQSPAIRQRLRQVPAVPIVHVKRSVMVLEPISETTEQAKTQIEEGKLGPSKAESSAIASVSGQSSASEPPKKKKIGPKGPNPLSVKKKKQKEDGRRPKAKAKEPEQPPRAGEKRKRTEDGEGGGRQDKRPREEDIEMKDDTGGEVKHRKRRRRKAGANAETSRG